MREIKFRGFEPAERKWIISPGFLLFPDGKITLKVGENEEGNLITSPINAETLGQFTGIKDKNGKDIYEGDIVKADGRVRVIKWVNGKYWFYAEFSNIHEDIGEYFGIYYQKVEVIGNIYENPELLK